MSERQRDLIARVITAGSPPTYESELELTHDGGGRLTEVDDSVNGVISFDYDDLDRLESETTPLGTVGYGYDDDDRRTSMTASGLAATSYGYDDADRLTSITRSAQSVGYGYDDANRLTSLTLPGGVSVAYGYDDADRLTDIDYANGLGALGSLAYGYDPAGRRHEVSGSWARLDLPAALATGTYDDANRLTSRGGTTYTHDDAGNLTGDGTDTLTWNARGELTGISGGQSASFAYDALGRRRSATIASSTTEFLHDNQNLIADMVSSSVDASYLTGLGIDETLTRTDSVGTKSYLTDILGSTVALADSSGAVQTEYAYEPYGKRSTTGSASGNRLGFTGRELDATGLQYSRAGTTTPSLRGSSARTRLTSPEGTRTSLPTSAGRRGRRLIRLGATRWRRSSSGQAPRRLSRSPVKLQAPHNRGAEEQVRCEEVVG